MSIISSSMTSSKYQNKQHVAVRFQGSNDAEASSSYSNILPSADKLELIYEAKKANSKKPIVDLDDLSKDEETKLSKALNYAKIVLSKKLGKSKTKTEKDSSIADYHINLFNALYETVAKKAPEAKDSAIGDLHSLFSTWQEALPALSSTPSFGDMPEDIQYKLVSGISRGLKSSHSEVKQAAAEVGESLGMTPEMLVRLQG